METEDGVKTILADARDVHIGQTFDRNRGLREKLPHDPPDVFPQPGMVVLWAAIKRIPNPSMVESEGVRVFS